jgi:uncharacterized protein YprB with RNaseH-like and TPR domain
MTNKRWTGTEDTLIMMLYKSKKPKYRLQDIAALVGRSQDATRNRLYQLRKNHTLGIQNRNQQWFDGARFAYWDIETTPGFQANFGNLLSWAMYCPEDTSLDGEAGGKVWGYDGYYKVQAKDGMPGVVYYDVIKKSEATDADRLDKRISGSQCRALWEHCDIAVTYYGARFDAPYARSRAMYWRQPFPEVGTKYHLDLWFHVRGKMKLGRNTLDQFTRFLGIEGKNHVDPEIWLRARLGDTEALKYVVEHNIEDVQILYEGHKRLAPYFRLTKRSL